MTTRCVVDNVQPVENKSGQRAGAEPSRCAEHPSGPEENRRFGSPRFHAPRFHAPRFNGVRPWALGVALLGTGVGFASAGLGASAEPTPRAAKPARVGRTFPGLDLAARRVDDGVTLADLNDGSVAVLSLDAGLERHVASFFERYRVPQGRLVALAPTTGRLLAYVAYDDPETALGAPTSDPRLDPVAPAASLFKIVTAAALLEAGVEPEAPVCYHGGARRLRDHHLRDDPQRDRRCANLDEAMGGSINPVFAKLASRHLEARNLERMASAFGFGHALPFDLPTRVSPVDVPLSRLEFARAAAGFWHVHVSPLHAALMAATLANRGRMPRPTVVDMVLDAEGRRVYRAEPAVARTVLGEDIAARVGEMMRNTVTRGTGRRAFYDRRGRPFLRSLSVAGKTGTLTDTQPYRCYSWFIGFAPVEAPKIALAALVVNGPRWRVKGAHAARHALHYWLLRRRRAALRRQR